MSFEMEPIHIAYAILVLFIVVCGILSHYANESKDEKSPLYKSHKYFLSFSIVCGVLIVPLLYFIGVYHKNRMDRPLPPQSTAPLFPMHWEEKLRRIGAPM